VIDASRLRVNETLSIIYFGYLAVAAAVVSLPIRRRLHVWTAAAAVVAAIVWVSRHSAAPPLALVREWLPALVILIGYFATGEFYVSHSLRAEAWLRRWDDAFFTPVQFARLSPAFRVYLDVVYDSCFLMIPAAFAVLLWLGGAAMADRFWTFVVAAEFAAFGTLPWFQARPPWAIEGRAETDATMVRRFSLFWVNHTSIRATTFPSGHASASLALALALAPVSMTASLIFGVLAVSIAVGSVVGRFHYAIDAAAGLLLAVIIWGVARLVGY
jgi:membrane-associated phospholipid phosphatase